MPEYKTSPGWASALGGIAGVIGGLNEGKRTRAKEDREFNQKQELQTAQVNALNAGVGQKNRELEMTEKQNGINAAMAERSMKLQEAKFFYDTTKDDKEYNLKVQQINQTYDIAIKQIQSATDVANIQARSAAAVANIRVAGDVKVAGMNNATSVQTTSMNNATSRLNNQETTSASRYGTDKYLEGTKYTADAGVLRSGQPTTQQTAERAAAVTSLKANPKFGMLTPQTQQQLIDSVTSGIVKPDDLWRQAQIGAAAIDAKTGKPVNPGLSSELPHVADVLGIAQPPAAKPWWEQMFGGGGGAPPSGPTDPAAMGQSYINRAGPALGPGSRPPAPAGPAPQPNPQVQGIIQGVTQAFTPTRPPQSATPTFRPLGNMGDAIGAGVGAAFGQAGGQMQFAQQFQRIYGRAPTPAEMAAHQRTGATSSFGQGTNF